MKPNKMKGSKHQDTDSLGRISKKGFNVPKRKGSKTNKINKNRPKAKKMNSPYKTKTIKKDSKTKFKGKAQFEKKEQLENTEILRNDNDEEELDLSSDEESDLNTTAVKSILKKSRSDKGSVTKEVSFSHSKENDHKEKSKKRKSNSDDNLKSEEPDAKTPKLCEMKKKDRKTIRRKQESKVFDLAVKSKKIWEDMRREDCSDEKRQTLCKTLMSIVQGHVKELIFAHDTVRVIECLMAHGNKDQRSALFEELKDCIVLLAKSKYAKFFVLKAMKYGSKLERNAIIQSFVGNVSKLVNHSEASSVLEEAYNEYANASQRACLVQEFYGPTFAVFKEEGITGLSSVLEKHPDQKDSIMSHLKELLMKLTEKLVVKHSIVHSVLKDYLSLADEKGRAEVIEAWRESLAQIVHTRDGARSAMMCLWHGTTKDRKVILKSFKTLVSKIAMEEHGSLVLMALFDCVDDTKFVEKVIINELLQDMTKLVNDNHGRKVLVYLLCPRDSHYCHPDIVSILSKGDGNTHSKKEANVRQKELAKVVEGFYLNYVSENIATLIKNNATCLFTLTILQKVSGDRSEALISLAKFMLSEPYHPPQEGNDFHAIEKRGCNLLIKRLIQEDKQTRDVVDKVFFSNVLVNQAAPGMLKTWIECNRGAFILLDLLETMQLSVVDFVSKELKGLNKRLSQLKYKGAELLLKKLKDMNVKE